MSYFSPLFPYPLTWYAKYGKSVFFTIFFLVHLFFTLVYTPLFVIFSFSSASICFGTNCMWLLILIAQNCFLFSPIFSRNFSSASHVGIHMLVRFIRTFDFHIETYSKIPPFSVQFEVVLFYFFLVGISGLVHWWLSSNLTSEWKKSVFWMTSTWKIEVGILCGVNEVNVVELVL